MSAAVIELRVSEAGSYVGLEGTDGRGGRRRTEVEPRMGLDLGQRDPLGGVDRQHARDEVAHVLVQVLRHAELPALHLVQQPPDVVVVERQLALPPNVQHNRRTRSEFTSATT